MRQPVGLFCAAILVVFLVGCATVKPASTPRRVVNEKPLLSDVSISGLIIRDQRVAVRAESTGFGSAMASYSGKHSSAIGSGIASGRNQSVVWEAYDNPILQEALKHAIENSHLAKKVVNDSDVSIEGNVLGIHPSTGFGKVSWNVFNTVSLLLMFGSPYLGSIDAEVELRLYEDGQLLAKSRGHGTADWLQHGYDNGWFWSIKNQAGILAGQLAVEDAVGRLVEEIQTGTR